MLGGQSEGDNAAYDVQAEINESTHGVELKTMVDNKHNKITMKRSAMERKAQWEVESGGVFHTVVFDDQEVYNARGDGKHGDVKDRVIYYRRGAGSFRVSSMHAVADNDELKSLMSMSEGDLPKAAQATASWRQMQRQARGED